MKIPDELFGSVIQEYLWMLELTRRKVDANDINVSLNWCAGRGLIAGISFMLVVVSTKSSVR